MTPRRSAELPWLVLLSSLSRNHWILYHWNYQTKGILGKFGAQAEGRGIIHRTFTIASPLHDLVTWYGKILCWNPSYTVRISKQRKFGLDWYKFICFESPTCVLRPSIIYSALCDLIVHRAYSKLMEWLFPPHLRIIEVFRGKPAHSKFATKTTKKTVNTLSFFAKKLPKRLICYRTYNKNEEDEYSRSEFLSWRSGNV